jgi:hypothetical protein
VTPVDFLVLNPIFGCGLREHMYGKCAIHGARSNGPLEAAVIVAPMKAVKDFEQWKGKLAGKIVLISYPEPPKDPEEAAPMSADLR